MLPAVNVPWLMAYVPTFSPVARDRSPVIESPDFRPDYVYVKSGSLSPYVFDFASAVTVNAF